MPSYRDRDRKTSHKTINIQIIYIETENIHLISYSERKQIKSYSERKQIKSYRDSRKQIKSYRDSREQIKSCRDRKHSKKHSNHVEIENIQKNIQIIYRDRKHSKKYSQTFQKK